MYFFRYWAKSELVPYFWTHNDKLGGSDPPPRPRIWEIVSPKNTAIIGHEKTLPLYSPMHFYNVKMNLFYVTPKYN